MLGFVIITVHFDIDTITSGLEQLEDRVYSTVKQDFISFTKLKKSPFCVLHSNVILVKYNDLGIMNIEMRDLKQMDH